jgi:tetratricopeptide (TPR) repeat protein
MNRQYKRLRLLTGASTWVVLAAAMAYAQAPEATRDEAAQSVLDRTQQNKALQDASPQQQEQELDRNKAAESLSDASGDVLSKLPTEVNLTRLKSLMRAEPYNLDHYFAYAQMAEQMGLHEEAAQTYEAMLKLAPHLDRVRLDLGAAYLRIGRLDDAKRELETVLERQPPDSVRENVETILTQIDGELREHSWSGSVSFGLNHDSNANSAPQSDALQIFETIIPLTADQRQQEDMQFFAAAGLTHEYRPHWGKGEHISGKWRSDVTLYHAEQSSLEDLDLKLFSFKTGPIFRSHLSGIQVAPKLGYNHIVLGTHSYLRSTNPEMDMEFPLNNWMMLTVNARHEFREFENPPGVTVYEDRTGSATQFTAGSRYILKDTDFLTIEVSSRRERTRVEYYDNEQLAANLAYTHLFPEDFFALATLGYRNTVYDGPDTALIGPQTRHDKERSFGLTLGKKLTEVITGTIGYQYRDTESNLINYDYDNHRFSATFSAQY